MKNIKQNRCSIMELCVVLKQLLNSHNPLNMDKWYIRSSAMGLMGTSEGALNKGPWVRGWTRWAWWAELIALYAVVSKGSSDRWLLPSWCSLQESSLTIGVEWLEPPCDGGTSNQVLRQHGPRCTWPWVSGWTGMSRRTGVQSRWGQCYLSPYSLPLFITPLLYSPGSNDWNSAQFPAMQFYPFMTSIDFLPVLLFDLNW